MIHRVFRFIGCYLLLNLLAIAFLVIVYGIWPRTLIGWCVMAVVGLPMLAIAEWVGDRVVGGRVSRWVDPSPRRVSMKRMSYLLLVILVFTGLWLTVWTAVRSWVEPHLGSWL